MKIRAGHTGNDDQATIARAGHRLYVTHTSYARRKLAHDDVVDVLIAALQEYKQRHGVEA